MLDPDEAEALRDGLLGLAAAWNAYTTDGRHAEQDLERLLATVEGVLVELWQELPRRLLFPDG